VTPAVANGTLRRDGVQVTGLGVTIAGTVFYLPAMLENGAFATRSCRCAHSHGRGGVRPHGMGRPRVNTLSEQGHGVHAIGGRPTVCHERISGRAGGE